MGLISWLKDKFPATTEAIGEIREEKKEKKIKALVNEGWNTSTGNGGEKWSGGISNNGNVTTINVQKTLQNARSAVHESPEARLLCTRPRDLTIDVGLKLEPSPAWEQLGITDDGFKDEWTRDHEQRYDMYMSSKQCHRSQMMTGYQIQRLWSYFDNRDNDQFARFYYSADKSLVSSVQIELIDPTQIIESAYVDSSGFINWQDGISRNEKGQEVAYKVRVRKKTNKTFGWETVLIPARGARSKRIFMIHDFDPEYAGQNRGYSKLHFGLQNFENIVDYVSAVVKKAINQNDIAGFIEPSDNAPASNPFEQGQHNVIPDAAIIDDDETETFRCVRPEYTTKVPGSNWIANLMPGEKVKTVQDTAPGPQFDTFITSITKYIAATRGWPIEVILMAFNSNYSASRAALLEAFRTAKINQMNIKAGLIDFWWEMWLSEEIAAGRTSAPGWNDPRLRQAWMRYTLQGPSLPSISPRDDIAAAETELKLSLTTQERLSRARNGSSADKNIIENTKQFAKSPTAFWVDEPKPADPKSGEGSGD
jgi:capsid protein